MKYLKYILLIGLMFSFTGCVKLTRNVDFNEEHLKTLKKVELKKVENKTVIIEKKENLFIEKKPNGMIGFGTQIIVNMTNLNEKVLKESMNQYFKNVEISNNQGYIYIDSKLLDYEYKYGFSSVNLKIKIQNIVKQGDKEILNKIYENNYDLNILITSTKIQLSEFLEEMFNKLIFETYETQFKPDLLKALEENQ
ncbi:hypothetical protein N5T82_10055 [Aliarcobacter cryaerophilus]|uniref:hypothetical protein n=1 Tax=Aliarcobacter cryaerophilus TaxID=28198 RepID=UPI0021B5F16E|nr:hypothetical protein [Aliarcobacter cryaerophilus]MCT7540186.1 hypothetical protein [Aliarcobacter cryaerophilus]